MFICTKCKMPSMGLYSACSNCGCMGTIIKVKEKPQTNQDMKKAKKNDK